MRIAWLLVLLAGCLGTHCDTASCPREIPPGCPADPLQECNAASITTCSYPSPLGSCEAEICTCEVDQLACARVAEDGASCVGVSSPACGSDAPRDCMQGVGNICSCGSDGVWHCVCSCYTANSGCGACPATYSPLLEGVGCDAVGNMCSFSGHSCTCTADATGSHFHCS